MRILLILVVFFSSCVDWKQQENVNIEQSSAKEELRLVIPEEIKKYSIRGIDFSDSQYNLPKLRETVLPDNDLEIRVRINFTNRGGDVLVIKQTSNEWQATRFRGHTCDYENIGKVDSVLPKSGWENAWQKLKEAGILSLSGFRDSGWTDGSDYIIETNINKTYLVYEFVNPQQLKDQEGKQMVRIGEIIAEEFGLETFKDDYVCNK